ncbi:ImmA/IrrE family metallo-endopeptidase [Mucilaginibacter sp.]|uniref:ImmA/IrrE family metallo-endopeptidase n=1 Tax=Mucilaginibacter sp. TaxID=1882438 RepID=UPI0035BC29BB
MGKHDEINSLLENIFKEVGLRQLFERRLHELKTTQTAIERWLGVSHRTLDGLLDGTQKKVDYLVLTNVALFLNMTTEEVIEIHLKQLEENFELQNTTANKKKFIKESFDLIALRKAGVIKTLNDYVEIENSLKRSLNLNSIFDYKKRTFITAFWAGNVSTKNTAKNALTRDYWLTRARTILSKLDNHYHYDREELIKYFPQIKWHSTNVEFGLVHVVKVLYRLGVTVIFQSPLSSLHLRGATIVFNDKPCIILTDYKGFYPTLWHCLCHELYHVLFDMDEIKKTSYHVSEDIEESLTLNEQEAEADEFARRYLFAEEKMRIAEKYIRNDAYVKEVARENNVHPSIVHIYYAYDHGKTDRLAWVRARREMPKIEKAIYRLEFPLNEEHTIDEIVKNKKLEIYN